jgi:hypothetical protein
MFFFKKIFIYTHKPMYVYTFFQNTYWPSSDTMLETFGTHCVNLYTWPFKIAIENARLVRSGQTLGPGKKKQT